jgi:outer membrane cobalamin receptor
MKTPPFSCWPGPVFSTTGWSPTWEAGLDWFENGLQASVTWFHTDFEDKIVSNYLADGTSTWKNEGDAKISGFQADVSYDLGMPLGWSWEVRPYVGFTALTESEDKTTGQDLLYVSKRHYLAGRFSIRGEVHNLFDEDYAYVKGYPMPGRSFFAGLAWEF